MSTVIRTAHAVYDVESVQFVSTKTGKPVSDPREGELEILARSRGTNKRLHHITVDRVGRPRFDAAVSHYFANR